MRDLSASMAAMWRENRYFAVDFVIDAAFVVECVTEGRRITGGKNANTCCCKGIGRKCTAFCYAILENRRFWARKRDCSIPRGGTFICRGVFALNAFEVLEWHKA